MESFILWIFYFIMKEFDTVEDFLSYIQKNNTRIPKYWK
jgi:hypothetical protein